MITNLETIELQREEKGLRKLTPQEVFHILATGIYVAPELRVCGTCRHHRGHKSFEETCPRVNELLFRQGIRTATQIMDDTKANGCLYHKSKVI